SVKVGLALALSGVEELQQPGHLAAAPGWPERAFQAIVQAARIKARRTNQSDVRQRGCQPTCEEQLVGRAPVHRAAGVEQQVDRQNLLLFEQLDEKRARASVNVPVHLARVVATGVRPVVDEFERGAAARAAPIPFAETD